MITDQSQVYSQYWNLCEYPTFRDYYWSEAESVIWFLQEAAEAYWDSLDDPTDEEKGIKMKRWWDRQLRRLKNRLLVEKSFERADEELDRERRRNRKKLAREKAHHAHVEDQLQARIEETRDDLGTTKEQLTVERQNYENLKEQWYCRKCGGEFFGEN